MIIQYLGDNSFLIRTKATEITAGDPTIVNRIPLAGPGEYEVGDAHIQGFPGAYLFSAEGINILYINNPNGLSDEIVKKIEEDIDILLLPLEVNPVSIKAAVKMVNDLDPNITIPTIDNNDHPFCKEIGGCQPPVSELKVSKKDMVEEVRKVVVLHARARSRH